MIHLRHVKSAGHGESAARWLVIALLTAITAAAVGWPATPSFAAGTYSVTAKVNVRSGPGTGSALIGTEPSGAQFTLTCQWQDSTSVNGNATWDNVTFANGLSGAIADYYTTTPSWNSYAPGTGACGAGNPQSSSLGGVDMQRACNAQHPGRELQAVATNPSSAYSWQCVGSGASLGINVSAECQLQYGYGAVAVASNPASAWSWYCRWNITAQMQAAANWALAQKGSTWSSHYDHNWSGWCEEFAEQAEGFQFGPWASAVVDYQTGASAGRIHTDTDPPAGALVFYGPVNGTGHVAVSIGNGQEVGTYGYAGNQYPIMQYPVIGYLSNQYLGWAVPFGS